MAFKEQHETDENMNGNKGNKDGLELRRRQRQKQHTDRDMASFSRHETKCFEVLIVPISNPENSLWT